MGFWAGAMDGRSFVKSDPEYVWGDGPADIVDDFLQDVIKTVRAGELTFRLEDILTTWIAVAYGEELAGPLAIRTNNAIEKIQEEFAEYMHRRARSTELVAGLMFSFRAYLRLPEDVA